MACLHNVSEAGLKWLIELGLAFVSRDLLGFSFSMYPLKMQVYCTEDKNTRDWPEIHLIVYVWT